MLSGCGCSSLRPRARPWQQNSKVGSDADCDKCRGSQQNPKCNWSALSNHGDEKGDGRHQIMARNGVRITLDNIFVLVSSTVGLLSLMIKFSTFETWLDPSTKLICHKSAYKKPNLNLSMHFLIMPAGSRGIVAHWATCSKDTRIVELQKFFYGPSVLPLSAALGYAVVH